MHPPIENLYIRFLFYTHSICALAQKVNYFHTKFICRCNHFVFFEIIRMPEHTFVEKSVEFAICALFGIA